MPRLALPTASAASLAAYAEIAAERRRRVLIGLAGVAVCFALSWCMADIRPSVFFAKIGAFTSYFDRLLLLDSGQRVWTDPAEWFWGLGKWTLKLGETLLIAYVGTLTGALLGFCVAFLAARNFNPNGPFRFAVKRVLEVARTVPDLVFALIFVAAFGLGPLPGVMALAIHSMGALGKLFSEIVENIDMKPVEGIAASGGGWLQQIRFAAMPQILAGIVSYTLLRFEINVRGAAVLGFVGAGGIGEDLIIAVRKFYYSDVSAILILIIVAVVAIDLLSEKIRHRLADVEHAR